MAQNFFKLSLFPQKLFGNTINLWIILILIIFECLNPKFTNILFAQKVTINLGHIIKSCHTALEHNFQRL